MHRITNAEYPKSRAKLHIRLQYIIYIHGILAIAPILLKLCTLAISLYPIQDLFLLLLLLFKKTTIYSNYIKHEDHQASMPKKASLSHSLKMLISISCFFATTTFYSVR